MKLRAPKLYAADDRGFFGRFGGRFVPEVLLPNLQELEDAFREIVQSANFWQEYYDELVSFSGRPTPLTHATRLSEHLGGAQIYFKREDLNQTGAHKINNVVGQGLLAKKLGKKRLIAETGAGQHGIATATIAARLGLKARIYMGAEDVARQRPNVFWMERLGAEVIAVEAGARTLKDAINEALRDWSANVDDTHYVLGTACGPHPFPSLVAYLQSVIGLEVIEQCREMNLRPHALYACVGGGSNALGLFLPFVDELDTLLVGVEAGGRGFKPGQHACRIAGGQAEIGITQGYKTLFLQDADGQMLDTHSISAGLDYVGVSPIIAELAERKRLLVESANDDEAAAAVKHVMKWEGIIPALESSHAIAAAIRTAPTLGKHKSIIVNLSGRGDKDIFILAELFADSHWRSFLESKVK